MEELERFRRDCFPGRTVVEVTDAVERACRALAPGQMIHNETFSLIESVSAIELGDPKVDVGTIPEARNGGLPSELLEAGMAPLEMDLDTLLSLLDGMLEREINWYRGSFLAETLYTCLYLHDMERLASNSILKAFCELTRLTCLKIVSVVHRAGVTEEEDFCIAHQGLPVHSGSDTDDPKKWLNFAQSIAAKLRKIASGTKETTSVHSEDFPITGALSGQDIENIAARLELRHNYLVIINCLEGGRADAERNKLEKAIKEARLSLSLIEQSFRETKESDRCLQGFHRYLNKTHMPAIPPRKIDQISRDDVVEYFKGFFDHAELVSKSGKCKSLLDLERHLEEVSDRNPETLIRSLQSLCCLDLNLKEVVASSIGLNIKFLESEPELACCLDKCVEIAQVYCKASCQNKCQQHRKYRKALRFLNDAANQLKVFLIPLQTLSQNDPQEGSKGNTGIERARSELAIEIVLNWLKTLAHSIALKQLLVGFDIDLYERSEFIMIYWYCERLLAAFIAIVQEWNAQLGRMNDMSKKQSKGKKQRKELKKIVTLVDENEVMTRIFVLEGSRLTYSGIVRMLAALEKTGTIPKPTLPFNTEEHRYVQRFDHLCFSLDSIPEPLCYEGYQYATNVQDMSSKQLCESAKLGFGNALRLLSHLSTTYKTHARVEEAGVLQRVCKFNQIAISIATVNKELKCDFEWEKRMLVLKLRS